MLFAQEPLGLFHLLPPSPPATLPPPDGPPPRPCQAPRSDCPCRPGPDPPSHPPGAISQPDTSSTCCVCCMRSCVRLSGSGSSGGAKPRTLPGSQAQGVLRPARAKIALPGPSWLSAACAHSEHEPIGKADKIIQALHKQAPDLTHEGKCGKSLPQWQRECTRRSHGSPDRPEPGNIASGHEAVMVSLLCAKRAVRTFPTECPPLKRMRGTPSSSIPARSTS